MKNRLRIATWNLESAKSLTAEKQEAFRQAMNTDRYGRTIADVYVGEQRVTLALVTAGLAWHYKKYSDDAVLNDAEIGAREAGRGLWSDPRHVAPWEWRRLSKDERDELR
jgi:endonuclease YncB( thermonuclease family)